LITCTIATFNVHSGSSQYDVLPDVTYVRDFLDAQSKFFPGFLYNADVIIKTVDYSDERTQNEMLQFKKDIEATGVVQLPFSFWLEDYLLWLQNKPYKLTASGRPPTETEFYTWLYTYLSDPTDGFRHFRNIVFQYGFIKVSRMRIQHIMVTEDFQRAGVMETLYEVCDNSHLPAIAYAREYLFWEQYVNLLSSNAMSLAAVAISIFIVVALFLGDLKTSAIVILAVMMIDVDLLGMMYFWDIGVSTVSLVNLLLCLGLAVDACAHITHAFNEALNKTGDTSEAVIKGLSTIGMSVFSGSFTSFLGILPLSIARHEILRIFFKFFFCIFLFGMLHGLMLVPVILSFIKGKKLGSSVSPTPLRKTIQERET